MELGEARFRLGLRDRAVAIGVELGETLIMQRREFNAIDEAVAVAIGGLQMVAPIGQRRHRQAGDEGQGEQG